MKRIYTVGGSTAEAIQWDWHAFGVWPRHSLFFGLFFFGHSNQPVLALS